MNEYKNWGTVQKQGAEPGTTSKIPRDYNDLKIHASLILLAYIVVDSIIWWIRGKLQASRKKPGRSTSQNAKKEWNQLRHTTSNLQQPADNPLKTARGEDRFVPATWGIELIQKQRELEEKRFQDRRKWSKSRTGFGKQVVLATPNTAKPVTPPRTSIFIFGSAKKPAKNENVPKGTCSPTRQTATTRRKNYHSKGIVYIKKRTTSKKLRRRKKHLMWMLEQEHHNPIRARPSKGDRRQPVYGTRPDNTNLPSKSKKRSKRTRRKQRARNRAPKKGKKEKEERRESKNEPMPQRMKRPKTSPARRQRPSPAGAYAELRSNKRYKPGD